MPIRLSDTQLVSCGLENRRVALFIPRVGDYQENIDDRFGGKARDGRRADMLDFERPTAKYGPDSVCLALKELRPLGIVA